MKTELLVVAGAMLIAASCPARSEGYVGVAVGQTRMKNACDGAPSGVRCESGDTAFRLFGGYQFTPNLAVELGYAALGTASANTGEWADLAALDLSAVASWPLANRFALHGRLGAYNGQMKASEEPPAPPRRGWKSGSTTDITFGLGASYALTANAAFRIEWQRFNQLGGGGGPKMEVDVFSVGALTHF